MSPTKKKSLYLGKRDLYLHNEAQYIRKRVLRSVDSLRTVRERERMQIEREVEREREQEMEREQVRERKRE